MYSNKFQKLISGETTTEPVDQLDIKTYAKYVLKTGSITEKRELLSSLKSRVVCEDKIVEHRYFYDRGTGDIFKELFADIHQFFNNDSMYP